MHYILEKEFETILRTPFRMENPKGRTKEVIDKAYVSDVLHWLLSGYRPMPDRGIVLDVNQLRRLNRVVDILEAVPEDGHFALEDADWETVKLVATNMAIMLSPRNAPIIEDLFNSAPTSIKNSELQVVKKEKTVGDTK